MKDIFDREELPPRNYIEFIEEFFYGKIPLDLAMINKAKSILDEEYTFVGHPPIEGPFDLDTLKEINAKLKDLPHNEGNGWNVPPEQLIVFYMPPEPPRTPEGFYHN